MKKPALRKNRLKSPEFSESKWTLDSTNLGEYIFRRLSLDQSNKDLRKVRPMHQLSQLIVSSQEINKYIDDYLDMVDRKRFKNSKIKYYNKKLNEIEDPEYMGHS